MPRGRDEDTILKLAPRDKKPRDFVVAIIHFVVGALSVGRRRLAGNVCAMSGHSNVVHCIRTGAQQPNNTRMRDARNDADDDLTFRMHTAATLIDSFLFVTVSVVTPSSTVDCRRRRQNASQSRNAIVHVVVVVVVGFADQASERTSCELCELGAVRVL